METEDQSAVIAFLGDPATHGDTPVERAETHISHLFLVGDTVYKLKKAVTLPYLDFGTVALRQTYCEREVGLNRRTAPELYRGVSAVTREADGTLALDGDGPVADWVVVMNRFDTDTLFDRLARRGELDDDRARALADTVARFHDAAEVTDAYGGAHGLRWVVDSNATVFGTIGADYLDPAATERLTHASEHALARAADVLEDRRREGRVRQAHGDLHLRNVCLVNDRPVLFDCIEFRDDLARIDVLYDLAFLVMDFEAHDRRRQANLVFNRYMARTPDVDGLAAWPLFLSLRAAIRAHVMASAAGGPDGDLAAEARDYLARAEGYLAPPAPRLVAVGGLSGSGKSRAAREIAPEIGAAPGALVLRTDQIRKRLWGVDFLDPLPEEAYSHAMTVRTYDAVFDLARRALRAGHSVVADGVFGQPEERADIAEVADTEGVPFHGLWLEAPAGVMAERIRERTQNASDATVEVLEKQRALDLGELTWSRVDTSGSREQTLAAVRAHLKEEATP